MHLSPGRALPLLALLLSLCLPAAGQGIPGLADDHHPPTFSEFQRAFDAHSRQANAERQRGWKWLKRWEDFEAQRMRPDGSPYDPAVYAREVYAAAQAQAATAKVTGGGWYPLGPSVYPDASWPEWETGLGRINCIAFHPTDSATYWVGVAQGGVWKTVNDGQSWTPLTDQLPMLRVSDICVNPVNTDEIYLSTGDYAYLGAGLRLDNRKRHTHYGLGVWKTTDGGNSWAPTGLSVAQTDFDFSLTRRVFIHPSNSLELVAAGTHGIWRSSDAGANWTQTHDSLIWDFERAPASPNVLYASTGYRATLQMGSAGIMKSTDFGDTWTVLPTGIAPRGAVQRIELAVSPSDPDYVYALCAGMDAGFGGLYRSTDAGASWTLRSSSPNILSWDEGFGAGGQGWYDLTIIADAADRDRIYTGGINIWGSTDGGSTWNGCSYWLGYYGPAPHADQHQLARNPVSGDIFLCDDGGLYATQQIQMGSWDDAQNLPGYQWPTSWRKLSAGMQVTSFYRCSTSPGNPGNLIAGAQDNSTYFYDGTRWLNVFGGDGMDCILHPTDPLTFYGSSQYGYFEGTNDGGLSTFGLGSVPESGEWTTPIVMHPSNPDILFMAYGNVYKSVDAGMTFNPISNFPVVPALGQPNISSALAMGTNDPDFIYVSKRFYHSYAEPGALWVTEDGGLNWADRTAGLPDSLYITSIAVDAQDARVAWVTCSGFAAGVKVFKTLDAGLTWANISGNLPNLPANCVVEDRLHPGNPIYVGMDAGIYYRNDTSAAWLPYATDLPNVVVSDLEVDASSTRLVAATFGRGLWGAALKDAISSGTAQGAPPISLTLAPNPNGGSFALHLQGRSEGRLQVEVIDILGRAVARREVAPWQGSTQVAFDLDLKAGAYFARVSGAGLQAVRRFVVE